MTSPGALAKRCRADGGLFLHGLGFDCTCLHVSLPMNAWRLRSKPDAVDIYDFATGIAEWTLRSNNLRTPVSKGPPGSLRRTSESRLHALSSGAHPLAELCQAALDSRAVSLHCCQTLTRLAPPGQDLQMVVARAGCSTAMPFDFSWRARETLPSCRRSFPSWPGV